MTTVKTERDMRPGMIARDGFLGIDERPLADILKADAAEVKTLGLTHKRMAKRMAAVRDAGGKGLGNTVRVPPNLEVRVESVRGALPCPFGHAGVFPKTNTTVRNVEIGREMTYSDLSIHMIEAHGFYEGKDAAYRLEPSDLAAVLKV